MPFEINPTRLDDLMHNYFELWNEVETLEIQQKAQKAEMLDALHEAGIAHHEVKGLGAMRITPPGERVSYDTEKLDALVLELIDQNTDLTDAFARKLRACKKVTQVSSFLRVEREKPSAKRPKTS